MEILALLMSPEVWIAFFTLTALELVLGIDNIIFISILVDRLPLHQREKARKIGLFFAMFMRIALLALLSWMVGATEPLFTVLGAPFSTRDLILLGGGTIAAGEPADLTAVDTERAGTVDPDRFLSMGRSTPFAGMAVRGEVMLTLVGGREAYRNGQEDMREGAAKYIDTKYKGFSNDVYEIRALEIEEPK